MNICGPPPFLERKKKKQNKTKKRKGAFLRPYQFQYQVSILPAKPNWEAKTGLKLKIYRVNVQEMDKQKKQNKKL